MAHDIATDLEGFHDLAPTPEDFGAALIEGLSATPKSLPCKFFYDRAGSALFDRICELPEYYPTRTEIALLGARAREISALMGPGCHLLEFGSGSSVKVRILLEAMQRPAWYTAIDISRGHLLDSCRDLANAFPDVPVTAVCGDYTESLSMPRVAAGARRTVGFFPGSSIGNFSRSEALGFLKRVRRHLGLTDGALLIGVDLRKETSILEPAYDDAEGVTAAFNLNLLQRANRELGTNFDVASFRHRAFYDQDEGRIEMHLVSTREQSIAFAGHTFLIRENENIHTENSYKYGVDEFREMAQRAGFSPRAVWVDEKRLFSVHYLLVAD